MNKLVAVVGIGTAGITTLSHLLAWLPEDWIVVSIYDPTIPIIGIGESTTTQVPENLYYGAELNVIDDADSLDLTVKHGVRYVNWRDKDIYSYIPPAGYAIHFNNFKLKDVCFEKFTKLWTDKFQKLEGKISDIENTTEYIKCKVDNVEYEFDYIIDCRGYPDDYTNYDIVETIPVNHCLVHTVKDPGNWNYTYHYAHPNGWMFGIPLKTRQGWGYLYNDTITKKDDAVENLAEILKLSKNELELREFSFKSFKAKKFIDKRLIVNGNRALFYEPLEALSGWFYDRVIRIFFDLAITKKYTEESANSLLSTLAEDYELFICYIYHGGSIYDSDFWRITKSKCTDRIRNSEKFQQSVEFLKSVNPEFYKSETVILPFPYKTWKKFDQDFGYNYFLK